MDKLALIYEFNKSSPLFAYVAQIELENNNVDKALEILETGLKLYPDYSTGLIIYSKALSMIGDFENAKTILKKATNIIDSNETYDFYLNEFEKFKKNNEMLKGSRRINFLDETFETTQLTTEESTINNKATSASENELSFNEDEKSLNQIVEQTIDNLENTEILNKENNTENTINKSIATEENSQDDIETPDDIEAQNDIETPDDIEKLVDKLEEAKMPPPPIEEIKEEPTEENEDNKEIISETLAGIYFAQGNLEEALSIYEKLILHQPEKAAFFKKRVAEIKELIESGEEF